MTCYSTSFFRPIGFVALNNKKISRLSVTYNIRVRCYFGFLCSISVRNAFFFWGGGILPINILLNKSKIILMKVLKV